MSENVIKSLEVHDVRFPTSLELHGSDAMHKDPDYSAVYSVIETSSGKKGFGIAFSVGRGNEIMVKAVEVIRPLVVGRRLCDVFENFGAFWREIVQDGQLRWLGPEKGVTHMATASVLNALWDLWARMEGKPVWKLLSDMTPEEIIKLVDFSYLSEALTKEEALQILKANKPTQPKREENLLKNGYPAYTTSTAWLGYTDEILIEKCKTALSEGWTRFKMKVGADLEDDRRRASVIRREIGYENDLMMDANGRWDVNEAITWMKDLTEFRPLWIEEPTHPDDILGHQKIAEALRPQGVGVATGECCSNRVVFKQLLQAKAIKFLQIDSARVGSINENIAILLLAKKFGVAVCPHAGGVGLCEMVQHIIMFDYLCVSATTQGRSCEYVDHLHEHFEAPVVIANACYKPPMTPGYSTEMKSDSVQDHIYPSGKVWSQLIKSGKVPPCPK